MGNNLSKHILATITYYDVMNYPMTAFEIWKHLLIVSGEEKEKFNLLDVINELEEEKMKRFIQTEKGFYFLKDRKGLAEQRLWRNKISEKKFKKLLRMVKILRFFPYIRMIGVTGRTAMKNALEKSDLDLFIIFQKGRLFTGIILVTFFLHLLGRRRFGKKIANRICLNHFATDEFLISSQDIFAANEYSFMIPIYGFAQFLKFHEKNDWIKKYKPNFFCELPNAKKIEDGFISQKIKKLLEKLLGWDFLEEKLKSWQVKRIKNNPKTKQAGSMIIFDDKELAFWPNYENQGPLIFSKFKERLNRISQF